MALYSLKFARDFEKDLKSIPKKDAARILLAVDSLRKDPNPPGSKKLAGSDSYRIRVGVYRILYDISNNELIVYILKVAHRKEAYR